MSDRDARRMQALAQPSSPASQNKDPNDYEIHWLIDYGKCTKILCVGTQIVRKGTSPHPDRTHILDLQGNKPEIPQIVGFIRRETRSEFHEDDFKWGRELLDILNDKDRMLPEDQVCVCERLKMVLYPVPETRQAIEVIEQSLEKTGLVNYTPQKMIEKHLRCIREAAMRATVRQYKSTLWTEDQISAMDVHTFFTVPEISATADVHMLQQLLINAGFQRTVALTETESAGAWRLYKMRKANHELPLAWNGDDEVLVADAGGLTLNVSSYKFQGFGEDGTLVHVIPTGNNQGSTCGSEMITLRFFDHIKEYCENHYGGFTSCHERLGYSSEAFYRRLATDFESFKIHFRTESDRMFKVDDRTHNGPDRSEVRFIITEQMVTTWFNKALDEIFDIIDKVKTERTKIITLTGGFFRSDYLHERLKQKYEAEEGIEVPGLAQSGAGKSDWSVVRGGMARSFLMPPQPPHAFCLGFAQDEPYDNELHKDVERGSSLIKRCRYTRGRFVESRWCTLVAPGDLDKEDFAGEEIWQEYLIAPDDNYLRKQVYVTHEPIQNHEPLMVTCEGETRFRPGIREWGEEIQLEVALEDLRQYRTMWPKKGHNPQKNARHLVWARLRVGRKGPSGMDITLSWEKAPPSFRRHTNEMCNFSPPSAGLTEVGSSQLHEANHSSFIQRIGATSSQNETPGARNNHIKTDPDGSTSREPGSDTECHDPPQRIERKGKRGRITVRGRSQKRRRYLP